MLPHSRDAFVFKIPLDISEKRIIRINVSEFIGTIYYRGEKHNTITLSSLPDGHLFHKYVLELKNFFLKI